MEKLRNSPVICCALIISVVFSGYAKEPKTIITGDQMELIKGGKLVIFQGNARVTRGDSILQADRLVEDKASKMIEASGNIDFKTLSKDRELMEASGEKMRYFTEKEQGELWEGRPHIIYHVKTSTSPVHLRADKIAFDRAKEEIRASGQVEVLTSSASAYAPNALFRQKERKITLDGRPQPRIVSNDTEHKGDYTADRIFINVDTRNVLLDGNVTAKLYDLTK